LRTRLPAALAGAFGAACERWRRRDGTRRLFARDAGLWTGADEASWLGWLDAPRAAHAALATYETLARDGRSSRHALVLGMGGSSLAPELQRAALGSSAGHPQLVVLDSIHPDQVAACEAGLDLASTLVVVASKSGSTLEPNLLLAHFEARLAAAVGGAEAPRRLVAITDPGSSLERLARERGFRHVVAGEPSIGGRFSALSPFGLVPAALQGIDLEGWLATAVAMSERCRDDEAETNPGVALGLLLAVAAAAGRDKLTLVTHPRLALLGVWLEQLLAESTGKLGRGILPFAGEPLAAPERYGDDRLFVALRLGGELARGDDERLDALAAAGHPVVELDLAAPLALAGELYRWEIATAAAGAELGVNPFDQPDVEAAKVAARRLAAEIERTGELPPEAPFGEDDAMALFAPESEVRALRAAAGARPRAVDFLRAHLARLAPGDYFALLAFCPLSEPAAAAARRLRSAVLSASGVATSVGFGPRYLHSTGQAHKGGPASGVFLVVGDVPRRDLTVPGQQLSFAQAIAAQARGDFDVLTGRGRRALRVELRGAGDDLLPVLAGRVEEALAG
jgi:transaldolase / glucose-6-phosphate isomerase